MVSVTLVAIVLFGAPLAVATSRLYRGREANRLSREATRAAGALPPSGIRPGFRIVLPTPPSDMVFGLYDQDGHRVAGKGPAAGGTAVMSALGGHVGDH